MIACIYLFVLVGKIVAPPKKPKVIAHAYFLCTTKKTKLIARTNVFVLGGKVAAPQKKPR